MFWLHPNYKLREAEQIDKFISIEITDPEKKNPSAHRVVADFMMHGPCGYAKMVAPYMKNSSGSKKFPRQFRKETTIEENRIVNYRWRNTLYYIEKDTIKLDNIRYSS